MVQTDAIEGIVNGSFRFHYDLSADVLYLRLMANDAAPAYGDLSPEGDILLRDEATDRPVGLTVISWWKRFGQGSLPDSISQIQQRIEPLVQRIAA